jgi:hypothetical protein
LGHTESEMLQVEHLQAAGRKGLGLEQGTQDGDSYLGVILQ